MDYKLSRKLMWIGIDSGLVLLAASMCVKNEKLVTILMIAAVAVFALGLLQALLFYKCPFCGCRLIKYTGGIPEHCPGCGEYLSLENEKEPQAAEEGKAEEEKTEE